MQPNAFTEIDRAAARIAWDIYIFEVNGTGFRWEFDGRPGSMEYVLNRAVDAHKNSFYFESRLDNFGMFISILEKFKNRPITQPHPLRHSSHWPATITRVIDEESINAYRQTHTALAAYAECLSTHAPDSREVADAAHRVAYTINPDKWRAVGAPVPTDARSIAGLPTRWYLEDVMASHSDA